MNPRSLLLALLAALPVAPGLLAQSLSGRVVDPNGLPIQGISVDPGRGSTPATSDANGQFTVVGLQNRSYDVEYRPAPGVSWVGRLIVTAVAGATQVGNVVLQPGHVVSGVVQTSSGQPIAGCNVNVYDESGAKLFTPHDGTDLTGAFQVTVPAGVLDVRILPPVGALLVPKQYLGQSITAPWNLGVVTLANAYQVTGTVVDAVTSVPVGATRITAFDALTRQPIPLVTDTANTFGQFTLLLPYGIVDLELDPPVGNSHVGRQLFGAFVLGPTNLGPVRLTNGVMLSGTVTGPGGAVVGADLDVFAADGSKVYTAHDLTSAVGGFAIPVPAGGTYQVRVEPLAGSGLVGLVTAPQAVAAATSLGVLTLTAGVLVSGTVTGPNGPENDANLNFVDGNGIEIVTSGDHTDASGHFATYVPAGTWRIDVETAEGSHGKPVQVAGVVVAGPTTWNHSVPRKDVVVAVSSFGIPTIAQGGLLPVNPFLHGLAPAPVPSLLDFFVELPDGQQLPVFPTVPLDVLPLALGLTGVWLPMPTVPATALGKSLKFVMRCREPVGGAVQDQASTAFVVQ